jgi:hypothetical protein
VFGIRSARVLPDLDQHLTPRVGLGLSLGITGLLDFKFGANTKERPSLEFHAHLLKTQLRIAISFGQILTDKIELTGKKKPQLLG